MDISKQMDIIGIDLGTTNSVATVYTEDGLKHISFDGDFLLPSVVNISQDGVIVGVKAKNMAMIAEDNTAISIKRVMGSDEKITLNSKEFSPEEISSFIIKHIKETAQKEMGEDYNRCVVTVPAYFNENQREATAQAVRLAGLEILRIINEPTAAAIAYGANSSEDMLYGVYDLGGGTFDISIIENSEGLIEVVATTGDNTLGGDDFDKKLSNLIWEKSKFDIERTKKLEIKLNQLAEKTKILLSTEDSVNIDEKFFAKKDGEPLHLEVEITKEEFEELISEDIDKTIELLLDTIEESNNDIDELEAIILTGGSSRIPLISRKILEQTGKLAILIEDPDKSVSIGAILQGVMIEGIDTSSILVDITPYSLGTSTLDSDSFDMELSLSKIILKNTPVPTSKTSRYYAVQEFQDKFKIDIYQGEDIEDLTQNIEIGNILLVVQNPVEDGAIDVTFTLNQDGMLSVLAKEIHTNEIIQGEFKTKISKSTQHSKVKEMNIINEHDKTIISKMDKLLKSSILDEDKEDLRELRAKYISAKSEDKASLEEEIIDTIFFLEDSI